MARTPKVVEDRREQILEAAMRVFAQKGFTRATNKDIAREAGITPGLIYHYFDSKEAVFTALIESRSPLRLLQSFPPAMLQQPPEICLHFLIMQVLNIVENEPFVHLIKILLPEMIHNPAITPFGVQVMERVISFLEHYLTLQIETGHLRSFDARMAAQCLVGSLIGFVLRRQVLADPLALHYSHNQIADAVLDTMLVGLFPR